MEEIVWILNNESPDLALNSVQFKEGDIEEGQIKVAQSHLHKKENESSYVKLKCVYTGTLEKNMFAEYLDYDGNIILTGKIKHLKELANDPITQTKIYEVTIYDKAIILKEQNLNKIFDLDQSPEALIKEIVEDYGLIFVNNMPSPSNVVIPRHKRYVDRDPIDAVNELCSIIGAVWRNEGDFFIIYRIGQDTSGIEIDANDNWNIPDGWNDDTSKQANRVIVKGAEILQRTTESLTGTNTVFYLTRTPHDVEIEGLTQTTETINGDYMIEKGDFEDGGSPKKGKITFNTSKTDPVVSYSYYSQIRVESKVGEGDIVREVQKKNLVSSVEARYFARRYLEIYGDGFQTGEWTHPYPTSFNLNNLITGQLIKVTNKLNPNRDGYYIISNIERRYPKELRITVGEDTNSLIDWQSETKERLKQLVELDSDSDFVQLDEALSGDFDLGVTTQFTKLFAVHETGEILFASETALTNLSDMIYDTGSEPTSPDPTPMAVNDDGLGSYPSSFTDYLEES